MKHLTVWRRWVLFAIAFFCGLEKCQNKGDILCTSYLQRQCIGDKDNAPKNCHESCNNRPVAEWDPTGRSRCVTTGRGRSSFCNCPNVGTLEKQRPHLQLYLLFFKLQKVSVYPITHNQAGNISIWYDIWSFLCSDHWDREKKRRQGIIPSFRSIRLTVMFLSVRSIRFQYCPLSPKTHFNATQSSLVSISKLSFVNTTNELDLEL